MPKSDPIYPTAAVPDAKAFIHELKRTIEDSDNWALLASQCQHAPNALAAYRGELFSGEGLTIYAYAPGPGRGVVFAPFADVWPDQSDACAAVTDDQINEAYQLFAHVARFTAKRLGIACHVKHAATKQYCPSRPLRRLLDAFVDMANLRGLHPLDWERFYKVIRYAHRYRMAMTPEDLFGELIRRGVPDVMARELSKYYDFGRALLRGRCCWRGQ